MDKTDTQTTEVTHWHDEPIRGPEGVATLWSRTVTESGFQVHCIGFTIPGDNLWPDEMDYGLNTVGFSGDFPNEIENWSKDGVMYITHYAPVDRKARPGTLANGWMKKREPFSEELMSELGYTNKAFASEARYEAGGPTRYRLFTGEEPFYEAVAHGEEIDVKVFNPSKITIDAQIDAGRVIDSGDVLTRCQEFVGDAPWPEEEGFRNSEVRKGEYAKCRSKNTGAVLTLHLTDAEVELRYEDGDVHSVHTDEDSLADAMARFICDQ